MDRRRLLLTLGGTSLIGIGGCLGRPGTDMEQHAETISPEPDPTTAKETLAQRGTPSTICEEDIRYTSEIHPIIKPAFDGDWSAVPPDSPYLGTDQRGLADDTTVIGVKRNGIARAYPIPLLVSHEIVNDTLSAVGTVDSEGATDTMPIIVTYCPLCRSGLVAERTVRDQPTEFYVSGHLWTPPQLTAGEKQSVPAIGAPKTGNDPVEIEESGNLVMYDEATKSFWSQLLATAICGPMAGRELPVVPTTVATWEDWRIENPTGDVLLPPPASQTTRMTS